MKNKLAEKEIKYIYSIAEYMFDNAYKYDLPSEDMYILGILHKIGHITNDEKSSQSEEELLDRCPVLMAEAIKWSYQTPDAYKKYYSCNDEDIPKNLILLWEAITHTGFSGERVNYQKKLKQISLEYGESSNEYFVTINIIHWIVKHIDDKEWIKNSYL